MAWLRVKNKLAKAHKSLTNWFNVTGIVLLSAILVEPSFIEYVNTHDLSIIIVIGNIILRFKTNKDLADK